MNYDERANLINSLSEAVNSKSDNPEKRVKRFDPATGTIYCNNDVEFDKASVIEARKLVGERRLKYERNGDAEGLKLCNISEAIMELYLNQLDKVESNK
jgi:hypothetical protein